MTAKTVNSRNGYYSSLNIVKTNSLLELRGQGYSVARTRPYFTNCMASLRQSWSTDTANLPLDFIPLAEAERKENAFSGTMHSPVIFEPLLDRSWSKSLTRESVYHHQVKDPMILTYLTGLNLLLKFKHCKLHTKDNGIYCNLFAASRKTKSRQKTHYPVFKTLSNSTSLDSSLNSSVESLDNAVHCETLLNQGFTALSSIAKHKRRHYNSESDLSLIRNDLKIEDTIRSLTTFLNDNDNGFAGGYGGEDTNIDNADEAPNHSLTDDNLTSRGYTDGESVQLIYQDTSTNNLSNASADKSGSDDSTGHVAASNHSDTKQVSEQQSIQKEQSECANHDDDVDDGIVRNKHSTNTQRGMGGKSKSTKSVSFADEVGKPLSVSILFHYTEDDMNLFEIEDEFASLFDDCHIEERKTFKSKFNHHVCGQSALSNKYQQSSDGSASNQSSFETGATYITQLNWWLAFPQPASQYYDFRQKLEHMSVSLENVTLNEANTHLTCCEILTFNGTIKVRNLHFSKQVVLHLTKDNWLTHTDYEAVYSDQLTLNNVTKPSRYDTFLFNVSVDFTGDKVSATEKVVEFAVRYTTGNEGTGHMEFWDNNNGKNYRIEQRQTKILLNQIGQEQATHKGNDFTTTKSSNPYTLDYRPNFDSFTSLTEYKAWQHFANETNYY